MKSVMSLTFTACLLVSAPLASAAEDHGHFFFFVAPADATSGARAALPRTVPAKATLIHVGGGGEGVLTHAWGVGTDFGGLARTRGVGTVPIISVNGFYHPLGQHHQLVDPYFTAGYGWFLRDGAGHTLGLPNLGGGLNYWLAEHHRYNLGFKVEVRGYVRAEHESVNYREVRIGVTLWQ
jgi:hypothetical protein